MNQEECYEAMYQAVKEYKDLCQEGLKKTMLVILLDESEAHRSPNKQ